jgi:hypothetical protein
MKASLLVITVLALVLGGCVTVGSGSAFDKDGLPKQQYYVGGGFNIDYMAFQPGTFYIIEKNTKKFLVVESGDEGEYFVNSIDLTEDNTLKQLKSLGIDPANVELSFYFIPASNVPTK